MPLNRRRSSGIINRVRLSRKKKKVDTSTNLPTTRPSKGLNRLSSSVDRKRGSEVDKLDESEMVPLVTQDKNNEDGVDECIDCEEIPLIGETKHNQDEDTNDLILSLPPRANSQLMSVTVSGDYPTDQKENNNKHEHVTDCTTGEMVSFTGGKHCDLEEHTTDRMLKIPPRANSPPLSISTVGDHPSTPIFENNNDIKILNTPPATSPRMLSISAKKLGEDVKRRPRRNSLQPQLKELDINSSEPSSSIILDLPFHNEIDKENIPRSLLSPRKDVQEDLDFSEKSHIGETKESPILSDDECSIMSADADFKQLEVPEKASNEERTKLYWNYCYGTEEKCKVTWSGTRQPPTKSCLSSRKKDITNSYTQNAPALCSYFPEKATVNFLSPKISSPPREKTPMTMRKNVKFGSPSAAEFDTMLPSKELTPLPPSFARERFPLDMKQDEEEEELNEETKKNNAVLAEWSDVFDDFLDEEEKAYEEIKKKRRKGRRSSSKFKPLPNNILHEDEDEMSKSKLQRSRRRSVTLFSSEAKNLLHDDNYTTEETCTSQDLTIDAKMPSDELTFMSTPSTLDSIDSIHHHPSPLSVKHAPSLSTLNSTGALSSPCSLTPDSSPLLLNDVQELSVALEHNLDAAALSEDDDPEWQVLINPELELELDSCSILKKLAQVNQREYGFSTITQQKEMCNVDEIVKRTVQNISQNDILLPCVLPSHPMIESMFKDIISSKGSISSEENIKSTHATYRQEIQLEWRTKVLQCMEAMAPSLIRKMDELISEYGNMNRKYQKSADPIKRYHGRVKKNIVNHINNLQRQINVKTALKEHYKIRKEARAHARSLIQKQFNYRALNSINSFQLQDFSEETKEITLDNLDKMIVAASWITAKSSSVNTESLSVGSDDYDEDELEMIVPKICILKKNEDEQQHLKEYGCNNLCLSDEIPQKQLFTPRCTSATKLQNALVNDRRALQYNTDLLQPRPNTELQNSIISTTEIFHRMFMVSLDIAKIDKECDRIEIDVLPLSIKVDIFFKVKAKELKLCLVYDRNNPHSVVYSLPSDVTLEYSGVEAELCKKAVKAVHKNSGTCNAFLMCRLKDAVFSCFK